MPPFSVSSAWYSNSAICSFLIVLLPDRRLPTRSPGVGKGRAVAELARPDPARRHRDRASSPRAERRLTAVGDTASRRGKRRRGARRPRGSAKLLGNRYSWFTGALQWSAGAR